MLKRFGKITFFTLIVLLAGCFFGTACGSTGSNAQTVSDSGMSGAASDTSGDSDNSKDNAEEGIIKMNPELVNAAAEMSGDIEINFSEKSGLPFFKKVNAMICGWLGQAKLMQCSGMISKMSADNVRIDLNPAAYHVWDTLNDGNYKALLQTLESYTEKDCLPYLCYFPLPEALKTETNTAPPSSYDGLYDFGYSLAAALKSNGITLAAHEIWNEPDLQYAFTGTFEEYLKLYSYAARGIYDANPDAVIGGLSAGELDKVNERNEVRKFIDTCISENLPLDFISYHAYNKVTVAYGQNPAEYTKLLRGILDDYNLPTVRLHLNEYNITQDAATQTYSGPAKALENLVELNGMTDIEQINWALFYDLNNTIGLVDTRLRPMAMYHMLTFYNNMPFSQNKTINKTKVSCIASSDEHRACVILWNLSGKEREFTLKLDGVPFEYGNITVYCITEKYSAYESKDSEFHIAYQGGNVRLEDLVLKLCMEKESSFYIELDDMSGINETQKAEPVGGFVRKDYYYYNRAGNCYAEYDRSSQTLLMGMGDSREGCAATSVIYEGMTDKLLVECELDSEGDAGICGMQIAYYTDTGCAKAVYYPIFGSGTPDFYWEQTSETAVRLSGKAEIRIKEQSPEGFSGRVRISFIIKDMDEGSNVKIRLLPAETGAE